MWSAIAGSPARTRIVSWRGLVDLGTDPARIVTEEKSRNTKENASLTAALMKPTPDQTWLLMTSAFHMPRSMGLFRKARFSVTAFPIGYYSMGGAFDFPFNVDTLQRRLSQRPSLV